MLIKTTVICDVTQCSLVDYYEYLVAPDASIYRVGDSLRDSGSRLEQNCYTLSKGAVGNSERFITLCQTSRRPTPGATSLREHFNMYAIYAPLISIYC
jgi:hypothetical protein